MYDEFDRNADFDLRSLLPVAAMRDDDLSFTYGFLSLRDTFRVFYLATARPGGPAVRLDISFVALAAVGAMEPVLFSCALQAGARGCARLVDATTTLLPEVIAPGRRLLKTEAAGHNLLHDFWYVVDRLAEADDLVRSRFLGLRAVA
ncbi:hypothetical protein [Micromonospora sp. AKA38]|uniref:hypothetical protein n=1 Tax=Micromonospora sp. AKA38 TaxID=2733861 RepID=UPI0022CAA357|nr:hypothetical protein [Micromonospora sp. AKA38]GHJ15505.1 hypothetical protein TPA0908_35000 [Micromonospora sp. AKA38]